MGRYDSMSQELKDYANKRIKESGIVMVPGHYPVFESKEQVDKWIERTQDFFDYCYKKNGIKKIKDKNKT